MTLQDVYDILIGTKVKNTLNEWHIYDESNNEISNGAVIFRGNIGALLMWPNESLISDWILRVRRKRR